MKKDYIKICLVLIILILLILIFRTRLVEFVRDTIVTAYEKI